MKFGTTRERLAPHVAAHVHHAPPRKHALALGHGPVFWKESHGHGTYYPQARSACLVAQRLDPAWAAHGDHCSATPRCHGACCPCGPHQPLCPSPCLLRDTVGRPWASAWDRRLTHEIADRRIANYGTNDHDLSTNLAHGTLRDTNVPSELAFLRGLATVTSIRPPNWRISQDIPGYPGISRMSSYPRISNYQSGFCRVSLFQMACPVQARLKPANSCRPPEALAIIWPVTFFTLPPDCPKPARASAVLFQRPRPGPTVTWHQFRPSTSESRLPPMPSSGPNRPRRIPAHQRSKPGHWLPQIRPRLHLRLRTPSATNWSGTPPAYGPPAGPSCAPLTICKSPLSPLCSSSCPLRWPEFPFCVPLHVLASWSRRVPPKPCSCCCRLSQVPHQHDTSLSS